MILVIVETSGTCITAIPVPDYAGKCLTALRYNPAKHTREKSMPYLCIQTNVSVSDNQSPTLLKKISASVAEMLGKPESYVMVALESATPLVFGGSDQPAAYLQLKSLGLPESATEEFSRFLCELMQSELTIPVERIYIEFSGPQRHMWGWNNKTF
jgi:phenylpyruvate tautomerase PptA (4-oxalocrotonate tautomerase family)